MTRVEQIVRDAMHADPSLDLDVATLLAEEAVAHEAEAAGVPELARLLFAAHPRLGATAANYVAVATKG